MLAALRFARRLQVCLLLLFLCGVGVAVASPLMGPDAGFSLVCSGAGGLKLADGSAINGGSAGDKTPVSNHKLDCPLCLPFGTPAPSEFAVAALVVPADASGIERPEALRLLPRVLRPPARAPPTFHSITEKKALP